MDVESFKVAIQESFGNIVDVETLKAITSTHGWTNENFFVESKDHRRKYIMRVNAPGSGKTHESLRFEHAILKKMHETQGLSGVVPRIVPMSQGKTFADLPKHGLCVLFELCEGQHISVIESSRNEGQDIVYNVAEFLGQLHTCNIDHITIPEDRRVDVEKSLGDDVVVSQRHLLKEHFNDERLQAAMNKNQTLKTVITELVGLHKVFFPEEKDDSFQNNHDLNVRQSLVHNDFHYDNVLFRRSQGSSRWELSAALDWELSFVGPSVIDVGLGLYFWCSCDTERGFMIEKGYAKLFLDTYQNARKVPLSEGEKGLIKRAMLVSIYHSVEFVTNPREDMMRKDLQAIKYDLCLVYLQRYLSVLKGIANQSDEQFVESLFS